jgi:hypothetical protein
MTTKYDLPRPGDTDWDAKHLEGSSYQCSVCNGRTKHNERYDAYYCPECNRWNEPACSDPTCEFCSNRPEKPL